MSDDIYFMMRGEGHAYWTMQNRLMSDLAKANQTIGMLNEQIDQIQGERDEARREVCEIDAIGAIDDGRPSTVARNRGWSYLYDKETANDGR